MGPQAVVDAGPLLHLHEMNVSRALRVVAAKTTKLVVEELRPYNVAVRIPVREVDTRRTLFYALKHELGAGESSCIALCVEENSALFLTDDLAARHAAKIEGLEPHGTIGILLKAYTTGLLTKKHLLGVLADVKAVSTLFITQKLLDEVIAAVRDGDM